MKNPVHIGAWHDKYTLGVFCAKTGLVDFAQTKISWLRKKDGDRSRVFFRGVQDHNQFTLQDMALEIKNLRDSNRERFDSFFREKNPEILAKILDVVRYANDWETKKQKTVNRWERT